MAEPVRSPPATFPLHPAGEDVLLEILAAAREAGPTGVVAFDLDSTLLDNRPRQAAIVREFAAREGVEALSAFEADHLLTGFDLREALGRAGLDAESVARWMPAFRAHWLQRFFTSDACLHDTTVPGAPSYATRVEATGVQLVYLTARPERMRPGTLEVLGRFGFPLPGERIALWMKPDDPAVGDEEFKRSTHAALAGMGRVVAAFENEPGHANDFRASFPEARVVLLATGHSGRVGELAGGITVVRDLTLPAP